jgi:hypothetical protein
LVVLATAAVNICVPFDVTVADAGETVMETGGGVARLLAVTAWVAVPVKFELSVAVTRTVKEPALA